MLRQIEARGHSAILYDPACEFIERFYDAHRGDIVLNPLDHRCPYWGPSEELDGALFSQSNKEKRGQNTASNWWNSSRKTSADNLAESSAMRIFRKCVL